MNVLRSMSQFLLGVVIFGCIDKIDFDIGSPTSTVVIDGFISDQPGPYTINVSQAFDIESKSAFRTAVSVKELTIFDDVGNREVLTEISKGNYQTSVNGMRGIVGSGYRLRVELLTGQVYESVPDTISPPGKLDSVYYKFEKLSTTEGGNTNYAFDIYFDASKELSNNFYLQWKFTATFKVVTNPEFDLTEPCSSIFDCQGCSICNFAVKCSGIRNIGKIPKIEEAIFIKFKPCECCACWYTIVNDKPILSGNQFIKLGRFRNFKVGSIPVHEWIFQHKVYSEVTQRSLSHRAYTFFKAIKDQKEATNSLFQPISGKISSNFVQISGSENPIEGMFFATSVSSKTIILTRQDVPAQTFIFPSRGPDYVIPKDCKKLFPNSTTIKPGFWTD